MMMMRRRRWLLGSNDAAADAISGHLYLFILSVWKGRITPTSMSVTARETMIRLYLCSGVTFKITTAALQTGKQTESNRKLSI